MSDFPRHIEQSKSQKMLNQPGRLELVRHELPDPRCLVMAFLAMTAQSPTSECPGQDFWSYTCNESDFPSLPTGISPAPTAGSTGPVNLHKLTEQMPRSAVPRSSLTSEKVAGTWPRTSSPWGRALGRVLKLSQGSTAGTQLPLGREALHEPP